jgi:potassium voltage-gated channel Eag-related subfamily H protein 3
VALLVYLLLVVPLRVAFGVEIAFNTPAFWLDACIDVYFIVDIFVNFRTGFYHQNGYLEINARKIAISYAKTWLALDVFTCLPITYGVMLVRWDTRMDTGSTSQLKVFRSLRLLKLGKLLRVARLLRMIDRYREQLYVFMEAFGGLVLSIGMFFLSHLIACGWYYLGMMDQEMDLHARTPLLQGWVVREWGSGDDGRLQTCEQMGRGEQMPSPPTSTNSSVCLEADQTSRYITSLYWAIMTISTVGFGDVVAQTDLEKVGSVSPFQSMTLVDGEPEPSTER